MSIPKDNVNFIYPRKGWTALKLEDVWQYRELLYFLAWRDIKVRYKQTIFGVLWAVIQPFFTMVVFSLFFGRLAQIPSDDVPYPIFAYAALVPWTFFANAVTHSSNSLVDSGDLIKKIAFPRIIVPIASILSLLFDFLIAFFVLLAMMVYFGIWPTANIIYLPLLLILAFITAQGVGLWMSALNVQFRDIRYIIPFIVQFWLFSTPIAYPSSLLEEPWRTLYSLNPMVGVVEGFRWALLGTNTHPNIMMLTSTVIALVVLVGGAFFFKRMERTFADVI